MSRNGDEAFVFELLVTNSSKGQKKKCKDGKKIKVDPKDIINYYKEPSHWTRDCLNKGKKDSFAALVQNDSSLVSDLVLPIDEQLQQHSKQWILDSGYSYHICPHKHWYVTYEKKFGDNVLMGNDVSCKSVAIGFGK